MTSIVRRIWLPAVLLPIVVASLGCDLAWTRFESHACGLSVVLPGTPAEEHRLVKNGDDAIAFTWYALEVPRDLVRSQTFTNFYEFGCTTADHDQNLAGWLNEARRWIPQGLDGELVRTSNIASELGAGVEFEIRNARMTYMVRLFAGNGRLYEFVAGKSGNRFLAGHEQRFLDSAMPLARKIPTAPAP